MKIILYQTKTFAAAGRGKPCAEKLETLMIEDDGSDDGGRLVAKFTRHDDAEAVANAMGWMVTQNSKH